MKIDESTVCSEHDAENQFREVKFVYPVPAHVTENLLMEINFVHFRENLPTVCYRVPVYGDQVCRFLKGPSPHFRLHHTPVSGTGQTSETAAACK